MLGTVLGQPIGTAGALAVAWVQAADLLAQGRGGDLADRAYRFLRGARAYVPTNMRMQAALATVGSRPPFRLMAFFAEDVIAVSGVFLSTVDLGGRDWEALLPMLTPTKRGFVRHRRDLTAEVRRALDAFGASDLLLSCSRALANNAAVPPPKPIAAADPDPAVGVAISELVNRLDTYRREHSRGKGAEPSPIRAEAFRFETDGCGVISWADGAPPKEIVGATLAAAAHGTHHGVDGHVAGAFRRRSPFRDARLTIGGDGSASGDWRISAMPAFTPLDGRFVGYRGTARRPRPDEVAQLGRYEGGLPVGAIAPDPLRQLMHEVRPPLNAIIGFAEMVEGQALGPVGAAYRAQAATIMDEGRRLLATVDDLDGVEPDADLSLRSSDRIDAAALLDAIGKRHRGKTQQDARFAIQVAPGLPLLTGDPIMTERMISRLLAAVIALASPGEHIGVTLDADAGGALLLTVARPERLSERDERTLLDPGYAPDGDWPDAPLLGLGFSLRLVRNLAVATGGTLNVDDDHFVLRLPAVTTGAATGER